MTSSAQPRLRERLSHEDRRKQLIRIGLSMLVQRPIHDLSLDAVAAEAGISRGLLFHYFPTKSAYSSEVIAAAGRRVLRNVRPDDGATPVEAITQVVQRYVAQIDRRRESYAALVFGHSAELGDTESPSDTLRKSLADMLIDAVGLPAQAFPVVHAWIAYVEDRALQWSAAPRAKRTEPVADVVTDCVSALDLLLSRDPDVAAHLHKEQ